MQRDRPYEVTRFFRREPDIAPRDAAETLASSRILGALSHARVGMMFGSEASTGKGTRAHASVGQGTDMAPILSETNSPATRWRGRRSCGRLPEMDRLRLFSSTFKVSVCHVPRLRGTVFVSVTNVDEWKTCPRKRGTWHPSARNQVGLPRVGTVQVWSWLKDDLPHNQTVGRRVERHPHSGSGLGELRLDSRGLVIR